MKKVTIIDYGTSNLKSIEASFNYLGYSVIVSNDRKEIIKAEKLVLPGVGSFPIIMNLLKKRKIDLAIKEYILSQKPFLGICLGMQVLFDVSYEFKKTKGLGILNGEVRNLSEKSGKNNFLIPNTGWVVLKKNKTFKRKNILDFNKDSCFFFTHSYFVDAKNKSIVSSYIDFGKKLICSSVQYKNIFGMQFHPEKSGTKGLNILKNFCKL